MDEEFIKNIGILNDKMIKILDSTLIIVFGLGGVGGFLFESLVRIGINNFIIIDKDSFEMSNLNRQLEANYNTIGKSKVEAYDERAKNINKNIIITSLKVNVDHENIDSIFDNIKLYKNVSNIYIADCIDDVNAKIEIIKKCYNDNLPLISCMGTANHNNTNFITISKLSKTKYCPLARKIRNSLKTQKFIDPNVLFINEEPIDVNNNTELNINKSTIQYVPAISGMKMAEFIINELLFKK